VHGRLDSRGRGDLPEPLADRVGVPRGGTEPVGGKDVAVLVELAAGLQCGLAAFLLVTSEQFERAGVEGQAALAVGLGRLDHLLPLADG
jgi:hypothetical protein